MNDLVSVLSLEPTLKAHGLGKDGVTRIIEAEVTADEVTGDVPSAQQQVLRKAKAGERMRMHCGGG